MPKTAVCGARLPIWAAAATGAAMDQWSQVSELAIGLRVRPGIGQLCHRYPLSVFALCYFQPKNTPSAVLETGWVQELRV